MDAQAQDRCHRIGQTRDVHIYRLVSEKTVEENILKKANEKRLLGNVAIEGGNFTTAFFKQGTINDLFEEPTGLDSLVKAVKDESSSTGTNNKEVGSNFFWLYCTEYWTECLEALLSKLSGGCRSQTIHTNLKFSK